MPHQSSEVPRNGGVPMSTFLNDTQDRLGRLAAAGLPNLNVHAQRSSKPVEQQSDVGAVASTILTTSSDHEDAESPPSLTLSRGSSNSSDASSVQTQDDLEPLRRLMFNPHTGETDDVDIPSAAAAVPLLCIFRSRGCSHITYDVQNWCAHARRHIEMSCGEVPAKATCKACPAFRPSDWENFMFHMATVHMPSSKQPSLLGDPDADSAFIHFLWGKRVIDDAELKELLRNPAGPLKATPLTTTAKVRERKATKEYGRSRVRVRDQ